MSEPSRKPPKKKQFKAKADPNLPDDESIRRLFPKNVVKKVNREIEHEPKSLEN